MLAEPEAGAVTLLITGDEGEAGEARSKRAALQQPKRADAGSCSRMVCALRVGIFSFCCVMLRLSSDDIPTFLYKCIFYMH